MIDASLLADISATVGEGHANHEVVIRMTPWSGTIIFNPCEKIPPSLKTLSGCDCGQWIGMTPGDVERMFLDWGMGKRPWAIREDAIGSVIVPEIVEYVLRVVNLQEESSTRPSVLLGHSGRERLRQCLEAEDSGKRWTGEEEFDRGDGESHVPGTVGLENFLAELLDSGDIASVWVGLACLWKASPDRIARLLATRVANAMEWPVVHQVMVHRLTYKVSHGLRRSLARRNLKRALLKNPLLRYRDRQRLNWELSLEVRMRNWESRDRRQGKKTLRLLPSDE